MNRNGAQCNPGAPDLGARMVHSVATPYIAGPLPLFYSGASRNSLHRITHTFWTAVLKGG